MANSNFKAKPNMWKSGELGIWFSALSLGFIMLIAIVLGIVIVLKGLPVFWVNSLQEYSLKNGQKFLAEKVNEEKIPGGEKKRIQLKVGNRDLYGFDFKWVDNFEIASITSPKDAINIERSEYGNFLGYLQEVKFADSTQTGTIKKAKQLMLPIKKEIHKLQKEISSFNNKAHNLELRIKKLNYEDKVGNKNQVLSLQKEIKKFKKAFETKLIEQTKKEAELDKYLAFFIDANGTKKEIPIHHIVRHYYPNQLTVSQKVFLYLDKVKELCLDNPRESNTEGGLFPAIMGTVILIFLMSILSFPLGVIAGVYLREYAKDGWLVRLVRIAVNNLAGVPSIVYGIFGLVFFVYGIGSTIDQFFYAHKLPNPTWGTGGILWASLTLGLLTIPVVIVATEEALGAIPGSVSEASLSLGATKFQTLYKVLIPMASPGILTGFILAMARAAGEVAPLMITGVVKLAPSLPIEADFPFFHLNRKFMHLGFHIYDIGFQSPNIEASKPFVFVTTFFLVMIVVVMCSLAIYLRNKVKKKYSYQHI